ncbi:hypothetical protein C2869_01205 [Saccharobesus litoralis]|uniref:Cytochrome C Planctomycete-type domain-containing protein n=2 Tax=Saccharobesus litoralis TaxID=2172099 RepID=A0A2S0VLR3_9ALTE|nr:hypothetical protein C2869_01205 [Saccharobesus litoralis]
MTLAIIVSLIWQDAQLKQIIRERLGISEKLQATEHSFYQQRVALIFNKYCVACHGENKAKGDLRVDSFRHTVFGGKTGDMLTGGEQSLLYQRMALPSQDRLAMPPYGRERQTPDEMRVMKMWLEQGASGVLTAADFPDAPSQPKLIKFAEVDFAAIQQARQKNAAHVKALMQQYSGQLQYIARTSHYLEFETHGQAQAINDQTLRDLSPVVKDMKRLNIAGSLVSEQSVEIILAMQNLNTLNVANTGLSAKAIEQFLLLPHLQKLIVSSGATSTDIQKKLQKAGIKVTVIAELMF